MSWKERYIEAIQNEFIKKKVLVIGDLMVDEYVTGKVKRISPEAPVPVLDYREKRLEAGGACNVAHNLKALGANVAVVGVAAKDEAGMWLRNHFEIMGIDISGVFEEEGRPTTIKTRYAVKGQQLLRVDTETTESISERMQRIILEFITQVIAKFDAVVISDYMKGMFREPSFVKSIISTCNNNNVLVAIDSKSREISAFSNADFVKPNNLELEAAVGITITDDDTLDAAGEKYLSESEAKALIVTRGSKGISVFEPGMKRNDYPAKDVQVFDVCGAGDTVISTITMGMCSGLSVGDSVRMANLAAGVVINRVGTVAVTADELLGSIYEEQNC